MQKIRILTLLSCVFLLGACEPSVESLAKDADKRTQILKDCAKMGVAAKDDSLCKKAVEAQKIAMKESVENMTGGLFSKDK